MARPVVFIDACVLFPPLTRGIVLRLAEAGLMTPRWSPRVLDEWSIAAARDGFPLAEAAAVRMAAQMNTAFPDASVTPDPAVERTLDLPDPADIHVLAGAIAAGAGVLLTFNMRDFPVRRLAVHGITPRHPDGFLWEVFSNEPEAAGQAIRETAAEAGRTDAQALRRDHRVRIRAGEQIPPLILAKKPGRGRQRGIGLDGDTGARRQRHLRRRHREAAVREVVRRRDQAACFQRPHQFSGAALGRQIDRRRVAIGAAVQLPEPGRLAEMTRRLADQHQRQVGQRRQIARRADRPLGWNDRRHARGQHGLQLFDNDPAHARRAPPQR